MPEPDEVTETEHTSEPHPAHKRAKEVSRSVPEIVALYRRLGIAGYGDGTWLGPEIDAKGGELNDVLWKLFYNQLENDPAMNHFKSSAVELAEQYLGQSWLHTPWLTGRILTQVLDSELVPLRNEAQGSSGVPGRLTSLLPGWWGVLVPAALSCVYFVGLAIVAAVLFEIQVPVLPWAVLAYMVWHFGRRVVFNRHISQQRQKLATLYGQLLLIRNEVDSGTFDPAEIERRLRRAEENGLYVHSLSYALLRIPKAAAGAAS